MPAPTLLSTETYYRATAGAATHRSLNGRVSTRICIIGGGFAGLATALSLMEQGETDVTVLEAERVGHGASGRNGGFVFGGFSLGEADLIATVGIERARQLYELTLDGVATIRRRIATHHIECDANDAGIYLANWFDDGRVLDARQRVMESLGVEWHRLTRQQLAQQLQSTRYFGALFEPNAFHFHPLKYAQGVAKAIVNDGAHIYEHSRALQIAPQGDGWRVVTGQGEIHAEQVVICCGGYLERLYPKLATAVLPIATYVMVTTPLGAQTQSAMQTQAAVYDTRFAFDYYRPLPDTRLLWGGRISIRERSASAVARLLHADLCKVYPQLADVGVDYAWSGMMSYGRHQMPQLGRLPEGLWYGMGFGGHGVGPTTLAGEVLARGILGEVASLQRFAPWGLPPVGGAAGLLAAQLTYWYYELRDWLRE
ncbi:MAG: FAD-binding oxidoreductase [Pseudomonadota bacterium]|nr:FAD-binding oxidoreductase [Pseudomonadota bacterium]